MQLIAFVMLMNHLINRDRSALFSKCGTVAAQPEWEETKGIGGVAFPRSNNMNFTRFSSQKIGKKHTMRVFESFPKN